MDRPQSKVTGVLRHSHGEEAEGRPHEDKDREDSNAATSQGTPGPTGNDRKGEEARRDSLLEL